MGAGGSMSSQEVEAEDWLCGGSGGEWRHGCGNAAAMDRHPIARSAGVV